MLDWLGNIRNAVVTIAHGMWITLRYWLKTYQDGRGTFTEQFEYPEKPVPVMARYRLSLIHISEPTRRTPIAYAEL